MAVARVFAVYHIILMYKMERDTNWINMFGLLCTYIAGTIHNIFNKNLDIFSKAI